MIKSIVFFLFVFYVVGFVASMLIKKGLAWNDEYHLAWADAAWESKDWYMHIVWLVLAVVGYFRKDR